MRRLPLCAVAATALTLLATTAPAQTPSSPQSEQDLRAAVTRRVSARPDQTIEFTIALDATVLVELTPPVCDVVDFVVQPRHDGNIWFAYGDGPTSKPLRRVTGALEQLGRAPCAAVLSWAIGDDGVRVSFRATADRREITALRGRIHGGELNWAMRLRTDEIVVADPIPVAERVAGFVRLWSEVKHNFVGFARVPDLDWDRVLDEQLPRVLQADTAAGYYDILRECMAMLRDGHSDVGGPSDEPSAAPPVLLAEVEGKAVIVGIRPPDSMPDPGRRDELIAAGLAIGDEVTTIDGQSIGAMLQPIQRRISASTPQWLALRAYPRLLRGEAGSKATLTVRGSAGATRTVALTRGYLFASPPPRPRRAHDLDGGIVHVALDSFSGTGAAERFEALLPKIRAARGLLLDVRDNGGGATRNANAILRWLTDRPLPGSRWKTRLYRPAFRAWGQPEAWHEGRHDPVQPRPDPFLGPVVVLTGPRTFSAAEDFLVVLKAAGRARLVGERTGGSTGQPLQIEGLPAGGHARVCTKHDSAPDGTEFMGIGVIPDVEVHPSVADLAAGRDAVFEAGLVELRRLIAQ